MKGNLKFKYPVLLTLIVALSSSVFAQETFRFQADIEKITEAGFYKINLEPDLIARSNAQLSDFRIIDNERNFVPYVKLESVPSVKEDFISFRIVENSETDDTTTTLIVENKNRLLIRSLWLSLKNTAVSRTADLLGSDDSKKWFAIDEDIKVQQAAGNYSDAYLQSLSFPASNYQFLKITIHNKNKNPVKILGAGIYSKNTLEPQFVALPRPAALRKDSSDRITYLQLSFKLSYHVNKLRIPVSSPKHFNRKVLIFEVKGNEKTLIASANLVSNAPPELAFSSKSNKLEVRIINGDNPALQFEELQAWQLSEYVIAYLEPAKNYKLLLGNKNAALPNYDLKFFTDSIINDIPEIRHFSLAANPLFKHAVKKEAADYTVYIWVAIIMALLLLSFLSWKVMNEVKSRSQNKDIES